MGWLEWRPGLACVLLSLIAGCADAGAKAEPDASASSLAPGTQSNIPTGTIAGIVVDEEERPLADVEVYLREASEARDVTDETGTFEFRGVPVGHYTIIASKFAYFSAESPVTVSKEASAEVTAHLAAVPQPIEPFTETFLGRTFISCGAKVGALTFSTLQVCEADPNHQTLFDFVVVGENGLTAVVLELAWDPTLPGTAEQLRNEFQKNPNCDDLGTCDPEVQYGRSDGPSPNRLAFGSLAEPFADGVEPGGPTMLTQFVFVPRDNEPLYVVALQQAVDNYVTAFYHSEPTADYTLVPQEGG